MMGFMLCSREGKEAVRSSAAAAGDESRRTLTVTRTLSRFIRSPTLTCERHRESRPLDLAWIPHVETDSPSLPVYLGTKRRSREKLRRGMCGWERERAKGRPSGFAGACSWKTLSHGTQRFFFLFSLPENVSPDMQALRSGQRHPARRWRLHFPLV